MNKQAFLAQLRKELSHIPTTEREEQILFYSEMIDDRMEEGLSEEQAVAQVGRVEDMAAQILAESVGGERARPAQKSARRRGRGETALLILGFPLWLPLLLAAFAVVLALYVSLWAVLVSLWACFGALAGSGLGGVVFGVAHIVGGNAPAGLAMLGAALVCVGLAILLFWACKAASAGTVRLTKRLAAYIGRRMTKKEGAQ